MNIEVTSNLTEVSDRIKKHFQDIANVDIVARLIATTILGMMKVRIHKNGLASDGARIGTYSKGYMKVRTGDFGNSARVSRGPNKGKAKNAGTFTERTIKLNKQTGTFSGEEKVGKERPKYNRTNDPKVIISLTSALENDEHVIHLGLGNYGIGFLNNDNFKKSQWVEETYAKRIFGTSQAERDAIDGLIQKHIQDAFS
jgi:hypothetical protein